MTTTTRWRQRGRRTHPGQSRGHFTHIIWMMYDGQIVAPAQQQQVRPTTMIARWPTGGGQLQACKRIARDFRVADGKQEEVTTQFGSKVHLPSRALHTMCVCVPRVL
jgi:hypothetical protein